MSSAPKPDADESTSKPRRPSMANGYAQNIGFATFETGALVVGRLVATLLFAWLIGAEAQGTFALLTAGYAIISALVLLSVDTANNYFAARRPKPQLLASLFGNSLLLGAAFAASAAVVGTIGFMKVPAYTVLSVEFLPLLTVGAALASSSTIIGAILFGAAQFRARAIGTGMQQAVFLFGMLGLTWIAALSVERAMLFWIAGDAMRLIYWSVVVHGISGGQVAFRWFIMRRQLRYGVRAYPYFVLSALNARLNQFFVGGFLGLEALGVFSIALTISEMILYLPKVLLNVVLNTATSSGGVTLNVFRGIATVLGLVTLAAALVGPPLITFGLAAEFSEAKALFLILLPGVFATGMGVIGAYYLFGRGAVSLPAWASFGAALATVAANLTLIPLLGLTGAAGATTLAHAVFCVLIFAAVGRKDGHPLGTYFVPSVRIVAALARRAFAH